MRFAFYPFLPPKGPPILHYTHHLVVPASAIDENGHVNNIEYIRWMQEVAIAHSTAVGCTQATRELNATWVVRNHQIQYRRPAFLGDILEIRTWVTDCRLVSSRRKYEFHRPSDKTLLARGETDWVLLDLATLTPKPIPQHIQDLYNPPAVNTPQSPQQFQQEQQQQQ